MKVVAITGISGHLGSRLQLDLEKHPEVQKIIGIDIKPPKTPTPKLSFCQRDVREPLGDALKEADSVVHLAYILVPGHNTKKAREVNVDATDSVLRACHDNSIKNVMFASSNTAYGAHPDNPVPIKEEWPLRPDTSWAYAYHKSISEKSFQSFQDGDNSRNVCVVRCCPVLGPKGVGTGIKEMFTPVVMVRCIGHDAYWQFVHEDDWANWLVKLMEQKSRGTFNIGGRGYMKYTEITKELKRISLPLPYRLLKMGLVLSWNLHLQSKSAVGGLEFLRYHLVLSTEKVERETGIQAKYTSKDALKEYLRK